MKARILVNGAAVELPANADVVETEPGVFSILIDGVSHEARAFANEVHLGGHRFRCETQDPRKWTRSDSSAAHGGRVSITAPMPGKVVRILAAVGDEVEAGQGILVVEAMKMQNELKSPRAGRLTALNVKEHDSVNAGAPLAVVE
jgi:biotin carboxyl carrier protein